MKEKSIDEIREIYELELSNIAKAIKKEKAKKVLLQFPDGLKPYALDIEKNLKIILGNKTEFFIWMDSCYGACDIPLQTERLGIYLIIQFGHSPWDFSGKKGIKIIKK
jgi:2-(3-amino-3-carboxypropyl)histidine synthase